MNHRNSNDKLPMREWIAGINAWSDALDNHPQKMAHEIVFAFCNKLSKLSLGPKTGIEPTGMYWSQYAS